MSHNYAESRIIDAIVFIDGVEVPYSALQVNFTMDQPSTATILIEPDEVIDMWRPKSWVHIFIRDPFAKAEPKSPKSGFVRSRDVDYDQQGLMLYWEGEVVSIQDSESAESRSTAIMCADLWAVPAGVTTDLVNIGAGLQVPVVNGSTFYGGLLDTEAAGAGAAEILRFFTAGLLGEDKSKVKSVTPDVLARSMLEYFGGFNASFGLQLVRTAMLSKITGLNDRAADLFVQQSLMREFINTSQQVQPSSTVMDFVFSMLQKFLYHFTTIPLPALVEERALFERQTDVNPDPTAGDSSLPFARVTHAPKSFCFMPDLYYAIPPMCNWLFPDQYNQRSVSRSFMQEPTRLGLQSSALFVIGQFLHLAPSTLDAYYKQIGASTGDESASKPEKIYGTRSDNELNGVSPEELDLNNRGLDSKLLKFLQPEEVEKGVIFQMDSNAYQELLNTAALFNKDYDTAVAGAGNNSREAAVEFYKQQVARGEAYPNYMKQLAQYLLLLRKNSRTLDVSGPFNPWPVVGLPMLVLRQGRSYRGLLTGMSVSIDYGGRASSAYKLDMALLVRTDQTIKSDSYAKATEMYQSADRQLDAAKTELTTAAQEVSFLSETEQKKLKEEVTTSEKLQALNAQAKKLRERKAAIDAFTQEANALRDQVKLTLGATYVDTFFAGLMEYVGFFSAALGLTAESTAASYARGFVAGTKHKGLQDVLVTALKDIQVAGSPSSAARVGAQGKLCFYSSTFASAGVSALIQLVGYPPGKRLQYKADDAVTDKSLFATVEAELQFINGYTENNTHLPGELEKLEAQYSLWTARLDSSDTDVENNAGLMRSLLKKYRYSEDFPLAEALKTNYSLSQALAALKKNRRESVANTREKIRLKINDLKEQRELFTAQLATLQKEARMSRLALVWRSYLVNLYASLLSDGDVSVTFSSSPDPVVTLFTTLVSRSSYAQTGYLDALITLALVLSENRPRVLAVFDTSADRLSSDFFEVTAKNYLALTDVQLTAGVDSALTRLDAAIQSIEAAYSAAQQFTSGSALEIPPVTPFANDSFLDVRKVDEALSPVVVPARTERGTTFDAAPGNYSSRIDTNEALDALVKTANAIQIDPARNASLLYSEFVTVLGKMFPLSATTDSANPTEWERAKQEGKAHAWANSVQSRKGTTLGEFMSANGLRLKVVVVQTPLGSSEFYQMVDDNTAGDEYVQKGARSYFSKFGNKDYGKLKGELDTLRAEAIKQGGRPDWRWMLAPTRQGLILSYARKHFAVGAFAGKR